MAALQIKCDACGGTAYFACADCYSGFYCSHTCQKIDSNHVCLPTVAWYMDENDNQEPIGIGFDPSSVVQAVSLGLAAKELFDLGRNAWSQATSQFPENKKWLINIKKHTKSHRVFWKLLIISGFINVLIRTEQITGEDMNMVVVPTDGAMEAYFRQLTQDKWGFAEVIAFAQQPDGARGKDVITQLLSAHFYHIPDEGMTCARYYRNDGGSVEFCGSLDVQFIKIDGVDRLFRIKKAEIQSPEQQEKKGFGQFAEILKQQGIVISPNTVAAQTSGRTVIYFTDFAIVPPARVPTFQTGIVLSGITPQPEPRTETFRTPDGQIVTRPAARRKRDLLRKLRRGLGGFKLSTAEEIGCDS